MQKVERKEKNEKPPLLYDLTTLQRDANRLLGYSAQQTLDYADLYDSANFEAKKMVVNQLIRRVDVYRGYQINISFNFDLTPYIEGE